MFVYSAARMSIIEDIIIDLIVKAIIGNGHRYENTYLLHNNLYISVLNFIIFRQAIIDTTKKTNTRSCN